MGFALSESEIAALVERALHEDGISKAREDVAASYQMLRASVRLDADTVRAAAGPDLAEYDQADADLESLKQTNLKSTLAIAAAHDEHDASDRGIAGFVRRRSSASVFWLPVFLGSIIGAISVARRWRDIGAFGVSLADVLPLTVGLGVGVVLLVVRSVIYRRWSSRWDKIEADLPKATPTQGLETKLSQLRPKMLNAVFDGPVLGQLRAYLDRLRGDDYSTTFAPVHAQGLEERFDSFYAVPTSATATLLETMRQMDSGSIGVAGPRGVGKTTLLRRFHNESLKVRDNKNVLSVYVPAPVQYEARDFLLYLFGAICQRILGPDPRRERFAMDEGARRSGEVAGGIARRVLDFATRHCVGLSLIGRLGIVAGLVLLVLGVSLIDLPATSGPLMQSTATPIATTTGSAGKPIASPVATAAGVPTVTNPSASTVPTSDARRFLREIDITSASTAALAWTLLVPSVAFLILLALALPTIWSASLGPLQSNSALMPLASRIEHTTLALRLVFVFLGRPVSYKLEDGDPPPVWTSTKPLTDQAGRQWREYVVVEPRPGSRLSLKEQAAWWLEEIRFQQSYSFGWSGALKLPIGLEGGVNAAMTLAQRQKSLPEIVDGMRMLIERASEDYQVIIAIDELDKMASAKKAEQFVNDVKVLFSVQNCFFLVSVSESAMSSFERRGLPFRNAFDSAFDYVIPVDYLRLDTARELLRRRVIGLSGPFSALGYCLSGGLPRDLVRICREMVRVAARQPANTTSVWSMASTLVAVDLARKLQAVSVVLEDVKLGAEAGSAFELLFKLERWDQTPVTLVSAHEALLAWAQQLTSPQQPDDKERAVLRARASALVVEIAVYLLFLATVLEVFGPDVDVSALIAAEQMGGVDRLVRARQLLTVDPFLAHKAIEACRSELELPINPSDHVASNGFTDPITRRASV